MVLNEHGESEARYANGSLSHNEDLAQTGDARGSTRQADSPEQVEVEEDNMSCVCPYQMMSHAADGWRKEEVVMDY